MAHAMPNDSVGRDASFVVFHYSVCLYKLLIMQSVVFTTFHYSVVIHISEITFHQLVVVTFTS